MVDIKDILEELSSEIGYKDLPITINIRSRQKRTGTLLKYKSNPPTVYGMSYLFDKYMYGLQDPQELTASRRVFMPWPIKRSSADFANICDYGNGFVEFYGWDSCGPPATPVDDYPSQVFRQKFYLDLHVPGSLDYLKAAIHWEYYHFLAVHSQSTFRAWKFRLKGFFGQLWPCYQAFRQGFKEKEWKGKHPK